MEVQSLTNWQASHPAFQHLIAAAVRKLGKVWVVGGAVRDHLLGVRKPTADLDIVIEQEAIPVARRLADQLGWAFYPMDTVHDIARLVFEANQDRILYCDISRLRGWNIEDDLATRDFTINAMALELTANAAPLLLDYHGGQYDLDRRLLKRVNALSLSEDAIRLLRAPRQMVQFDLSIDPATRSQIERLADTVRLCSAERVRDELWRMTVSRSPSTAVEYLESFGLLNHVLPEVASTQGIAQSAPHHLDVYGHTLAVVGWTTAMRDWLLGATVSELTSVPGLIELLEKHRIQLYRHFREYISSGHRAAEWLIWSALLHDVGKPATQTYEKLDNPTNGDTYRIRFIGHEDTSEQLTRRRLEQLHFSSQEVESCSKVVRYHMRLHLLHRSFAEGELSQRAVYRYYRDISGRQPNRLLGVNVVLLSIADYLGTYQTLPDDWHVYLQQADQLLCAAFSQKEAAAVRAEPLVDGRQLMKHLHIQPGIEVGNLLEQIREAQAVGEVTTADEALILARKLHRTTTELDDGHSLHQ